jgi:hypothetical protein
MADATMRELFSMGSDPRKCFLRGPVPGYITRVFSSGLTDGLIVGRNVTFDFVNVNRNKYQVETLMGLETRTY